ncbi:hypothetical protein Q8F55_005987 [Vanrija albida]|uniref:Alpha/beta hydrolase fold-3 domain-containing protein n=1 Tax=Vanrija albida TaxID=181172 RepID=A0ABR3Q460_9TREE
MSQPNGVPNGKRRTLGAEYKAAAAGQVAALTGLLDHVRATPDAGARQGEPNRWVALAGLLASFFLATAAVPLLAARYFLRRPEGFNSFPGYVLCRLICLTLVTHRAMPPVEDQRKRARALQLLPFRGLDRLIQVTNVTIPPVSSERRPAPEVPGIQLPGYMLSSGSTRRQGVERAAPGEKLILYFHGGGYVDGHPLSHTFAYKIARDTSTRVFGPTYRKVLGNDALPGPLVDAYAAWEYVLSLGFAPHDIVLMGDSAGGHLSLEAHRTESDADPASQLPGGLALCSPWCDLTLSAASWSLFNRDFIVRHYVRHLSRACLRYYTEAAWYATPLSPVFAPEGYWRPFAHMPVFVSYGQDEALADEDKVVIAAMRRDGVDVRVFEEPHGLHVGPITPWSLPSAYEGFAKGVVGVLADL